jgi:hypothetical protein
MLILVEGFVRSFETFHQYLQKVKGWVDSLNPDIDLILVLESISVHDAWSVMIRRAPHLQCQPGW